MRMLRSGTSIVVLLAAFLLAGPAPAWADDGDESLMRLLGASDVVVDATLVSLMGPKFGEAGVAHYAAELDVRAYIKGSLPLPPQEARAPGRAALPRATIVRFELEEADRLPFLKEGARVVLFLKRQPEGAFPAHVTADIWLGVQPYGPWFVRRLATLVRTPPPAPSNDMEPVAAFWSANEAAATLVGARLAKAGIKWVGVGNAGGETIYSPGDRAAQARRILMEALAQDPLHQPPFVLGQPQLQGDAHDFRVLDAGGHVVWIMDPTLVPPPPADTDVLEYLARFPGSEVVTRTDGTRHRPAYGYASLEAAETALAGKVERPWTVEVLRKAYAEASTATDAAEGVEALRAALVTLLAASRDEGVLALVGAALDDASLEVRVAATFGILSWWCRDGVPGGGLESAMDAAATWWNARSGEGQSPR